MFSENALLSGFDEVRRDRDVEGTCTMRVLGGTLTLGGDLISMGGPPTHVGAQLVM